MATYLIEHLTSINSNDFDESYLNCEIYESRKDSTETQQQQQQKNMTYELQSFANFKKKKKLQANHIYYLADWRSI